jgi:hypothetical protein
MTAKKSISWDELIAIPRPSRVIDFPRKGPDGEPLTNLAMWVLTQQEMIEAAASAERFTRKAIKDMPAANDAKTGYDNVYNSAATAEVLFRASRKADDLQSSFFPAVESVRQLTGDEVGVLMNHYLTVQAELGPIVAHMTSEEMEAMIDQIAKSGSRFPLDLLSADTLKTLVLFSALRVASFSTATSSPGSLPVSE